MKKKGIIPEGRDIRVPYLIPMNFTKKVPGAKTINQGIYCTSATGVNRYPLDPLGADNGQYVAETNKGRRKH
jgi:hypothetical protein